MVQLVRHDLNDAEQCDFLAAMTARLRRLADALAEEEYTLVGQVPTDDDVVGRVRAWLVQLPNEPVIAASPRVR